MDVFYDRDGEPIDVARWTELHADLSYVHVRMTAIDEDTQVSTVWVGIDQSFGARVPLIFETMVFGGPLDHSQQRYPNLDAAEAGHEQAVAACREAVRQS